MYAVIASGGKQYRVQPGALVQVEKLAAGVGETVEFPVLLASDASGSLKVGTPILSGATVRATVVEQGRHKKIKVVKFRRRKHHQKQMGHRQYYTAVRVTDMGENLQHGA